MLASNGDSRAPELGILTELRSALSDLSATHLAFTFIVHYHET